jgi:hypothetical protein
MNSAATQSAVTSTSEWASNAFSDNRSSAGYRAPRLKLTTDIPESLYDPPTECESDPTCCTVRGHDINKGSRIEQEGTAILTASWVRSTHLGLGSLRCNIIWRKPYFARGSPEAPDIKRVSTLPPGAHSLHVSLMMHSHATPRQRTGGAGGARHGMLSASLPMRASKYAPLGHISVPCAAGALRVRPTRPRMRADPQQLTRDSPGRCRRRCPGHSRRATGRPRRHSVDRAGPCRRRIRTALLPAQQGPGAAPLPPTPSGKVQPRVDAALATPTMDPSRRSERAPARRASRKSQPRRTAQDQQHTAPRGGFPPRSNCGAAPGPSSDAPRRGVHPRFRCARALLSCLLCGQPDF